MRSYKSKEQIFRESFALFTDGEIPNIIFYDYLHLGESSELQEWVVNNMKSEIMDWCTGIGIIEAVEHLYECAEENGNII